MSDAAPNKPEKQDDAVLAEILTHDHELWSVAEQFMRTLPDRIKAMREALHSGSYERLRSVAHHLKSSGAYLGCRGLSHRAAQIEQAAHDQVLEELAIRTDELTALIAQIEQNIRRD